jgi:hypothetical protein
VDKKVAFEVYNDGLVILKVNKKRLARKAQENLLKE